MLRSLFVGGACLVAFATSAASAQHSIADIGDVFLESATCSVGSTGSIGSGSQMEVDAYLNGFTAARAAAGLTNDGNGGNGAGSGNNNSQGGTQVVYLDFNPGDPTFPVILTFFGTPVGSLIFDDYIYTQQDRDLIEARLDADYALYNYDFTQFIPTEGPFSTLTFGDNDNGNITLDIATGGLSILFGAAENIDFRNDNRADNAFIDASLWKFLAELDRANGTNNLGNLSGIPVGGPGDIDAVEQLAVQNQSSNTGGHELGHIQGLRHHDAIGTLGDGLPPALNPGAYIPVGETDTNAVESLLHLMASGASVGLPLTGSTLQDRFFGERSAVKLALNANIQGQDRSEAQLNGKLQLKGLGTPNPLEEGVNANLNLQTRQSLVNGRIDVLNEVDPYSFKGDAGQVFNAEVISLSDNGIAEPILGLLSLKFLPDDGSPAVEVARNRLTFEGFEPMIIDFELPFKGDYVLEVSSPDTIDFGDGVLIPLILFGISGFEIGDYDLHAYIVKGI